MRIAIVGAGGMGGLFGAILGNGGLDVSLIDTDRAHVDAIRQKGLRIEGYGGDRLRHLKATIDAGEIDYADVVIFQCKAHATRAAAEAAKHLVDRGGVAICLQNGLGNEDVLADVLGAANVLGGLTTMAGCKLGPGVVRDFSRTPTWIGEIRRGVSERAVKIASTFTEAGLETHASTDIVKDIWKKLLSNIALSALSGITDLTSTDVLAVPELRAIAIAAVDEALGVARAVGIELDHRAVLDGIDLIAEKGGTGDNKSSLCVDLLNGRRTEVDVIYGSVIQKAREHGVPTPTLNTLAAIVTGLESRNSKEQVHGL